MLVLVVISVVQLRNLRAWLELRYAVHLPVGGPFLLYVAGAVLITAAEARSKAILMAPPAPVIASPRPLGSLHAQRRLFVLDLGRGV